MRGLTMLVGVLAAGGCLRQTTYQCSDSATCGASGQCESTGYCSLPDPGCESGRRYGDSAGALAGACVDAGGSMIDAGDPTIDGNPDPADATVDSTSTRTCPSGYVTITGGQPGHLYQVVPTSSNANWDMQVMACANHTANQYSYMAIPDDAGELAALSTAAGNSQTYWIGVSDKQTEGTWLTVLNTAQSFFQWATGPQQPDDKMPGEDCVAALSSDNTFSDEKCGDSHMTICECAP